MKKDISMMGVKDPDSIKEQYSPGPGSGNLWNWNDKMVRFSNSIPSVWRTCMKKDGEWSKIFITIEDQYTPGSRVRKAEELKQLSGAVFEVVDNVDRGCAATRA